MGSTVASKSSLRSKTRTAIVPWVIASPRPASASSTTKLRNSRERRGASKSGLAKMRSSWRRTARAPGARPSRAAAGVAMGRPRCLPTVYGVLGEGDLDRLLQLRGLHGLDEVAVRPRFQRPLHPRVVDMGGQVDDGNGEALLKELRRLDAVEAAPDAEVDEGDIGTPLRRTGHGLLRGGGDGEGVVPQVGQAALEVVGDDALVVHDQHGARRGGRHLGLSGNRQAEGCRRARTRRRPGLGPSTGRREGGTHGPGC